MSSPIHLKSFRAHECYEIAMSYAEFNALTIYHKLPSSAKRGTSIYEIEALIRDWVDVGCAVMVEDHEDEKRIQRFALV